MRQTQWLFRPGKVGQLVVAFIITLVYFTTLTYAEKREDKIRDHIVRGFDHIYNLEYESAEKTFRELIAFAPDDPSGYCYLSGNLWLRELVKGRELALENFTSAAYFSKTPKRAIDPKLDRQFREYCDEAIAKANGMLQKNPRDARALYFLGSAYGLLASFEMTIHRRKIAALRDAGKAVEHHRQVLQIDATYYDSYMTVGLYEYISGKLPWSVRWIARLLGYRGDKQKGLRQLKLAAEKGRINQNDAQVVLSVLYVWEMQFDQSLSLMLNLHKQFPKNYLLELDAGALYRLLRRDEQAAQLYQGILQKIKNRVPHYDKLGAEQVHYRLGILYLDNKSPHDAIEHFAQVIRLTGGNEEIATLSHLKMGEAYDLASNRPQAQEHYKIVLKREDVKNSQELARKYLRKPYLGMND
ncbi:MAG: DUF3808 domain-containing protein [Acidobacteria bacterium]|nr:DUF3808 domain-containing protein [Acidobacteriota bacterium]MBI3655664.1 DUF3808 domain-containing protein [Acidobacteriota bacterium]